MNNGNKTLLEPWPLQYLYFQSSVLFPFLIFPFPVLVICPPFPVSLRNILISNYNVFFIICQMSTSVQALYQMTATTTQFAPTLKVLLYADASMVILEMAQIAQVNNLKVLCLSFITEYVVIQFYPRFQQIKPFIYNGFTTKTRQPDSQLLNYGQKTPVNPQKRSYQDAEMRTRTCVALTYQIHGYNNKKKYSDGTAVNEILTKIP